MSSSSTGDPQQVRQEVQVAEHGLAELFGSANLVACTVQREGPAQEVPRLSNVVRELLREPLEGIASAPSSSREQHVVRPDLVALARAVSVEAVLLFLLFELAFVAP